MRQHIRTGDHVANPLEIDRVLQIRGNALLVSVDGVKQQAGLFHPLVANGKLSTGIPGTGAFHLDHPGTKVGQPKSCRRAGQVLAEFQDSNAGQGLGGRVDF